MKKWLVGIGLFLVVVVLVLWQYVLPIPTGYAAKYLCSSIFVAEMDEVYTKEHDLKFSLVAMTTSEVDYDKKSVRSTFFGLKPHVAVYRSKDCGCTLLVDRSESVPEIDLQRNPVRGPDTLYWPYGSKENVTTNFVLQSNIDRALDEEFSNTETGTRAIVVVHEGKIVGERYAEGFDRNSAFLGWSMTKSIIATLVGILVNKGLVDIYESVPIELWSGGSDREQITWAHLLQMSSGLEWSENYKSISDATKMLYTEGDSYGYAITSVSESPPDSAWEYSSGTTNILSGLIRSVINNDTEYHQFPFDELFDQLHAGSFVMEIDAADNFVGSSYSYATARDWAKIGILYLNNGVWNGNQILPNWWAEFVASPAIKSDGHYGAQFWLNEGGSHENVSQDMFYADGFQGQRVFIIPSLDLVVVRLGLSIDEEPDYNQFLSLIIGAIKKTKE